MLVPNKFSQLTKVCVLGHLTKDVIRIRGTTQEKPGGVAYYFTLASKSLGSDVSLITKVAEKDFYLLGELRSKRIPIFLSKSESTTVFENIYPRESLDFRMQRVRSVAQPFSIQNVRSTRANIFHLGPLTKDEIPIEILKYLAKRGQVSLDVQGYLREVRGEGIEHVYWGEKDEALAHVSILKTDRTEAMVLSGTKNIKEAAAKLGELGPKEVVITLGSQGSLIYSKNKLYQIPSFSVRKIVDPTGCGDTYMAGYIHKRLTCSNLDKVGQFAAAVASLKLGHFGPFKGRPSDVEKFLGRAR